MASRAVGTRAGRQGAERGASPDELGAVAFAALALALLAVVGLASSTSPWEATRAAASAPTAAAQALAVAAGVVLVLALLLLWVETPMSRRQRRKKRAASGEGLEERGRPLWTAVKTLAVILLGLAVFFLATLPLYAPATPAESSTGVIPSTPGRTPVAGHGSSAGSVDLWWLLLPMALTFAVLAPLAFVIRRRRARDEGTGADEGDALGRAVRASIAELESERDPRTAILRAYARMEQAFRGVEIVRARDETASEFLARTTRRLPVSADAAAELTGRFEEVRFSTHPITETHRQHALASLHRVERELEGRP